MKHLTTFNRLFEGIEDGNEIIRALKETPAGKELQKLLGVGSLNYRGDTIGFEERFHLARTGRVNINEFGGKTHAERTATGKWMHISKSSGGTYGENYTDTVDDLIKSLITTFVAKKRPLGVNDTQFKVFIRANIEKIIASKLDVNGIIEAYIDSLPIKTLGSAKKITESNQYKILMKYFENMLSYIGVEDRSIYFRLNLYPLYSLGETDYINFTYNISRAVGIKKIQQNRPFKDAVEYNVGAETIDQLGKYLIDGIVKVLDKYETKNSYTQGLLELRNAIASIKNGETPNIENTINVEDFTNNVKEYIEEYKNNDKFNDWRNSTNIKTLALDLGKLDITPQPVLSLLADVIIDENDLKLFSEIREKAPALDREIKAKMGDSADLASDLGALGF